MRAVYDFAAPSAAVFARLADVERLPGWAPEFCAALRIGRDGWRVDGPAGEFGVEVVAEERTGIVMLEVRERTAAGADLFALWIAARADGGTRVRLAPFAGPGRIGDARTRRIFSALSAGLARLPDVTPA